VLFLLLIITGCSDSGDLGDASNHIRGHITLANTPIESVATQSSAPKVKSNVKALRKSSEGDDYVPDEIIVSVQQGADIKRLLQKYNLSVKKSIKELGVKTLTGIGNRDINTLVEELNNQPEIKYAELNKIVRIMRVGVNDPYYSTEQWNYLAISLPEAWEINTGSAEVTVAVIDTGIDLDHPDLKGSLVSGIDCIDYLPDSETGFITYDEDDFPGPEDRNGHGTHVAGVIGATVNNQLGVAGINWNVNIIPIRVLDSDGYGRMDNIVAGIKWAVHYKADIINLSLGINKADKALADAIDYAYNKGLTVIAAAGNGGGSGDLLYPANYNNVISVGSINQSYQRSYFSNYGDNLDFVAPGENIYSTYGTAYLTGGEIYHLNSYKYESGTSMATPHVSGVAALLLAQAKAQGKSLTPEQLKEELRLTAQDLGDKGRDDQYGYGLINAHAALADARITKAKVFTGEEIDYLNYEIKLKSNIIQVSENGTYALENNDEGNYYVYCWIDLDQEGEVGYNKIDKGDYFARTSSPVGSGNNTNLELNLITEDNFEELEIID